MTSRTAAAIADPLASSGCRPIPASARTTPAVLRNWSAACGRHTCGSPSAAADSTVPEPPCDTTAAQCASTATCGTQRSTRTWAGCGPSAAGSPPGPTVASTRTSRPATARTAGSSTPAEALTVPSVT